MPRTYKVEGTKTFLYWSLGLLALGLWCIKDGWFPSDAILTKYPLGAAESANFYVFNKSLAIICMIGSAVTGYIHKVVK